MRVIAIKRVMTITKGVSRLLANSSEYIIHKAEYKGIRMRRARDTTQSRFQRYAYIALA